MSLHTPLISGNAIDSTCQTIRSVWTLYSVRVHSNKNTWFYYWTCHSFNRDIVYREKRKLQITVHPSSPAPGEQAITKENNVPVSDEYTRSDPRTVKYEDVFRRARRKYHNAKQLHSSDLLHR